MTVLKTCYCGFVFRHHLLVLSNNFITLQGTKVLEDREVRFNLCYTTEGTPQRQALSAVFKYTGARSTPEWIDIERGSVFRFSDFFGGDSSRTEKFETLCNVQADLSTAPYQTKYGKSGKICYTRNFSVILLVGLTELKAQIAWVDSTTVSFRRFNTAHHNF